MRFARPEIEGWEQLLAVREWIAGCVWISACGRSMAERVEVAVVEAGAGSFVLVAAASFAAVAVVATAGIGGEALAGSMSGYCRDLELTCSQAYSHSRSYTAVQEPVAGVVSCCPVSCPL